MEIRTSNRGGCKSIVPALKGNIRKANTQMKLKIVKRYLEEDIPQACSEQKKIEDPLTNEEKTTSFWLMQKMLKYLMLILP